MKIKLKDGRVVEATKAPVVWKGITCPSCGKLHKYFYHIHIGQIEDDDPSYPNYASRRECEVEVVE